MHSLRLHLLLLTALASLLGSTPAFAQSLRSSARPAGFTLPNPEVPRQADFIVAVVNAEPITNHEVNQEAQRLAQQIDPRVRPAWPSLLEQTLDRMIDERAQLQLARESGIRVEDTSIDQAERGVAQQNQLTVEQLRQRITQEGSTVQKFREQLRDQLMLTRLREREVEPRVRISDLEVEQHLAQQQLSARDPGRMQINLAQVLVAVPESADEATLNRLRARAEDVLLRARSGEDFAALARAMSDAPERNNGGQLGLRRADRYPPLFLDATAALAPGELSGVLRSGAGFHILKVIDKQVEGMPPSMVTQSRSRHILLRPTAQLNEAQTVARLRDFKRRIESGQATFEALAREYSQDGSAEQGGELGWANPGQFVPEFETVMNKLQPSQISEPLISRFGVHLIQLLERRRTELSAREQREVVRAMLREKKLDETFASWARDVRGRAYVEMRDPAQ